MKLIIGAFIYLAFGSLFDVYTQDVPVEKQEQDDTVQTLTYLNDYKVDQESTEQSTLDHHQPLKQAKKIPIRQRFISPHRGPTLVNTSATLYADGYNSFEVESQNDNDQNESDEGMIDVAYAQELLEQNAKVMSPTFIRYEQW